MSRWWGFANYGGLEMANAERVASYAKHADISFFSEVWDTDNLSAALSIWQYGSGGPYVDPETDYYSTLVDGTYWHPWFDPDDPHTKDFLGFYLTDAIGVQDGGASRVVTESATRGGNTSPWRVKSRQMVFRGVLVGTSSHGTSLGLTWLKGLLQKGDVCDRGLGSWTTGSTTLDYFLHRPDVYSDQFDLEHDLRSIVGTELLQGPTVLRDRVSHDGCGAFMEVEFTLVAENPYIYTWPNWPNLSGSNYTYADWLDTALFNPATYQTVQDNSTDGTYNGVDIYVWNEKVGETSPGAGSPPPVYDPADFQDPLCATPPSFPGAPQDDITCRTYHNGPWDRKVFTVSVPGDVPTWGESVPTLYLKNKSTVNHLSDIRIRFTAPGGLPDTDYEEQFFVTSLPTEATMNLCGVYDRIMLNKDGYKGNAEHLVFSTVTGTILNTNRTEPFRFPVLSCGGAWTMTVDIPDTASFSDLDVALRLVGRES